MKCHSLRLRQGVLGLVVLTVLAAPALSVGFADLESRVQKFTLPNGLTFVVLERHEAPVFSFRTFVDAGGVDEHTGITGIAHMFEHMAFKGTESVGTTDYRAEKVALDAVDAAWAAVATEMEKGFRVDSTRLASLTAEFKAKQEEAGKFVISNDFSKVCEEAGATGFNAFTGADYTQYLYNLPSNRFELWARMEGDRLTRPVLREFYKEREVVQEERRFGESSAAGRLFYAFINASFQAHPYGIGTIGFSSDLKRITRQDAFDFFKEHYTASNITIAIVGDVKFDEVKRYAEKYFSGVAPGPKPHPVRTIEPVHQAEVRVVLEDEAQPVILTAWHTPNINHPDFRAYELLSDILSTGRSSRLYERLVKDDRSASQIFGGAGFPGEKYPGLLLVEAVVSKDASLEQVEKAIYDEVDRLIAEGPTADELAKVKRINKAGFIRGLRGNQGLAGQLARWEEQQGDYGLLFDYLDQIEKVTPADIQRVARESLTPSNRVVGMLKKRATS